MLLLGVQTTARRLRRGDQAFEGGARASLLLFTLNCGPWMHTHIKVAITLLKKKVFYPLVFVLLGSTHLITLDAFTIFIFL
jgi:hypothetical protein